MRIAAVLCLAVVASLSRAEAVEIHFEDYPPGLVVGQPWRVESFGWTINEGALETSGTNGSLFHEGAGFGSTVTVSAVITPLAEEASDWPVCGVTIGSSHGDAWRLNLVRAPEALDYRHLTELHMSRHGMWLAESDQESLCPHLEGWTREGWTWEWGTPYRMALTLDSGASRVTGAIESAEGELLARHTFALAGDAVRAGWGGVSCGHLAMRVEDLVIDVAVAAEPPVAEPLEHRPYEPIAPAAEAVFEATGFFRTQQAEGRWWIVDPEGRPVFLVGTDHCNFNVHHCEALGYAPYNRNMVAKYGSAEAWAASATERLASWNFNVLAANHSPETRGHGLAHKAFVAFGSNFARSAWIAEPINWTGFPDVFHPNWEPYCKFAAKSHVQEFLGDPWLVGYFLDNELEWYGKGGFLVDDVYKLPAQAPAKQALVAHLREEYGDIDSLNAAFGSDHADFDALLAHVEPPPPSEALAAVREAFLARIAERYFAATCDALKAADPDHMVIGCRFAGQTPAAVLDAAARHLDVFTINTYPRVDMDADLVIETPAMLLSLYERMNLPMIITEWSFPALDSGLPCKYGAGMRVDTQEQKAECYRIFAETIASMPFMVGYNYFMWVDEPELGISSTFPEDSNYGLVDVNDEPYTVLTDVATAVNGRVQAIHAESDPDWQPPAVEELELAVGPTPDRFPDEGTVVGQFTKELGPLTLSHEPLPNAGLTLRAGDLTLGTLYPLMHQVTEAGDRWVSPNRTESIRIWDDGEEFLADFVFSHPGQRGMERSYRVGYRVAARVGSPVLVARILWVENTDDRPLNLRETFHYPLPMIGGSPEGDVPGGPDVPNYYFPSASWHDPEAGGWLGVAAVNPTDFQVHLWIGEPGGHHADVRRAADVVLEPGERWDPPQPWLAVYGFGPDDPDGWRQASAPDAEWKQWLLGW